MNITFGYLLSSVCVGSSGGERGLTFFTFSRHVLQKFSAFSDNFEFFKSKSVKSIVCMF